MPQWRHFTARAPNMRFFICQPRRVLEEFVAWIAFLDTWLHLGRLGHPFNRSLRPFFCLFRACKDCWMLLVPTLLHCAILKK
jgi:hypothetical protein